MSKFYCIAARNGVSTIRTTTGARNTVPIHQIFRFSVRIAHARYLDASLTGTKYTTYNEGWTVGINRNATVGYDDLKRTLRSSYQAKCIPFFEKMTQPEGTGHWLMAQNHCGKDNFRPYLYVDWSEKWPIQDVVDLQPLYTTAMKKLGLFPITLIWYPDMYTDPNYDPVQAERESSYPFAFGDDSILVENANQGQPWYVPDDDVVPVEEGGDSDPLPDDPLALLEGKPTGKGKGKAAHKRAISTAIPRHERANEREGMSNDQGSTKGKGATTRSGRAIRPKKK
jgi:hypothetical protein